MKKNILFTLVLSILLCSVLVACAGTLARVDYENAEGFETALNSGTDVSGKTVTFTVKKLAPNSAFGYNLQAGEHLNFCSAQNPDKQEGDTVTVKVKEVTSMLGAYIISYEMVK